VLLHFLQLLAAPLPPAAPKEPAQQQSYQAVTWCMHATMEHVIVGFDMMTMRGHCCCFCCWSKHTSASYQLLQHQTPWVDVAAVVPCLLVAAEQEGIAPTLTKHRCACSALKTAAASFNCCCIWPSSVTSAALLLLLPLPSMLLLLLLLLLLLVVLLAGASTSANVSTSLT
jgi:hypothetical protein